MKFGIPNAVSSRAGIQMLRVQKHSPSILFVAGVVGVGATVVLACRATLKLDDVLTDAEKDIQNAKYALGLNREDYTERQYKKDMAVIYTKHAVQIGKLYAPSVVVGSLSIAALTGSHNILTRRNAGLTAAYAASEKALREYRERVSSELGIEKEREIYHGAETKTITVEDTNGPKKVKTKMVGDTLSPYAVLWGKTTSNDWKQDPVSNHFFLRSQQSWLNDQLYAHGYVTLNDVKKALGLPTDAMGQQVGWVKNNPKGDGVIDFGCWNGENPIGFCDFFIGDEQHIWLDFNVDGNILDLI